MKKMIALLCLLAMILPLCACSSGLASDETASTSTTMEKTTKDSETGDIVYPKGFSVGYARADVSMAPLPIHESTGETVHDPLQLTVTALCDGENAALVMSIDLAGVNTSLVKQTMQLIQKNFGIPSSNVILNATHTHSAHTGGSNGDASIRWTALYCKQLLVAVEEALRDLTPAKAFGGKGHTDGITFVRRYLMENGRYRTNPTSGKAVAHETEADNEMRTIRFQREGKKDVLMVNYQTHYGGATSKYPRQVSADFVHPFRQTAEKELNCHFAYQSGCSGNLNFESKIPGERKYADFVAAIKGLMITTRACIENEEALSTDKIICQANSYQANVIQDTPERIAQANEVIALAHDESKQSVLVKTYGFASKREASAVVTRAGYGKTQGLLLTAITCGDLAFAGFPYEMFDTNGQECRAASPYKMTFTCSLTNGSYGYIPSAIAFPHGGYEVYATRFVGGTAEEAVTEMLRLLGVCKENT